MDVVLLIHLLEFTTTPQAVLQEVERVLIPGGHLLLIGFNPWGLWGLCRLLFHRRGLFPWCGKFRSVRQLTNWLTHYGLTVEQQRNIMFLPPLSRPSLLHHLTCFEPFLQRLLPWLGAVYILRAIKRVAAMTPLEPVLDYAPLLAPTFGTAIRGNANGQVD